VKPTIGIVTDSTGDIPVEEAARLGIHVVPAIVTIEGETFVDGQGLSRQEFYRRLPEMHEPPTTAAPSPQRFAEAYESLLSAGFGRILSIHVSSKLSAMLGIAAQAAAAFGDRVHVFDSAQVSMGLGFQAMEAATLATAGASFEAVLDAAQRARERVWTVAMIDTLEYLRRSGRVSWLRAGLGEFLRVKLLVQIGDGVVQRIGEVRTRHKAVDQLLSLVESRAPLERLAVLHSGIAAEAAALAERLRPLARQAALVVDVTTVIGTHVGPGSIGASGLSA